MTFLEAIEKMRQGEDVRRKGRTCGTWLHWIGFEDFPILRQGMGRDGRLWTQEAVIQVGDMLANDWESIGRLRLVGDELEHTERGRPPKCCGMCMRQDLGG